jgi:hypothetical protein
MKVLTMFLKNVKKNQTDHDDPLNNFFFKVNIVFIMCSSKIKKKLNYPQTIA